MKVLFYKFVMCLAVMMLLLATFSIAMNLYLSFSDGEYSVDYLEEIDATCVKTFYQAKAVMDCLDGNRLKVTP